MTAARLLSRLLLAVPWTRRYEMNRLIGRVADHHQCTRSQAFALIYAHAATDDERAKLDPYNPIRRIP